MDYNKAIADINEYLHKNGFDINSFKILGGETELYSVTVNSYTDLTEKFNCLYSFHKEDRKDKSITELDPFLTNNCLIVILIALIDLDPEKKNFKTTIEFYDKLFFPLYKICRTDEYDLNDYLFSPFRLKDGFIEPPDSAYAYEFLYLEDEKFIYSDFQSLKYDMYKGSEIYDVNSEIKFGKHKNKQIRWILDNDFQYIKWALINLGHFVLDYYIFWSDPFMGLYFNDKTTYLKLYKINLYKQKEVEIVEECEAEGKALDDIYPLDEQIKDGLRYLNS